MTDQDYFSTEFVEYEEVVEPVRPTFTFKLTGKILLVYFLGGMLVFPVIGTVLAAIILEIFGAGLDDPRIMSYSMFIAEMFSVFVLIKMCFDIFKYDLNIFLENAFANFGKILKHYVLALGVSFLLQLVYDQLGISQSVNQDMIVEMTKLTPLLMVITTVIFAPLAEEIIFRGALFKGLMEKMSERKALILSSLIFGGVHLLAGVNSPLELLFIFQYASMGYFMAKSYQETDSIWGAILHHFFSNMIAVIAIFYV